jgi:DNA polymerase III subunit delta'
MTSSYGRHGSYSLMMLDRVSGFTSIRDQNRPIGLITTYLRKGTIPHAFLFTGIEGIGKRMTATAFAMACLCESGRSKENRPSFHSAKTSISKRPCLNCHACRRVASGIHPDVIRIKPEGAFIRIRQIRALCATLSMKPYEGEFRVVLIANANQMNAEAGNALLKVLEEPPQKTILILTASAASELLPTIVSRCQSIVFNPLTQESIASELVEKKDMTPGQAKTIAILANGSMSKAFEMVKTNFTSYRKWLLKASGVLPSAGNKIPVRQGLALSETLSKQKETLNDSLEIIKSWLRDVLLYPYSPAKIINQDMINEIRKLSQTESTHALLKKLSIIENAQKIIAANGNPRLTLDVMLLELTQS